MLKIFYNNSLTFFNTSDNYTYINPKNKIYYLTFILISYFLYNKFYIMPL
ncbi:hypothetical protein BMS3Abin03_00364 [bacterium BMS3Abin03]|nr:hypothetical protein BMS3Abin03_00364 [bacterium BMS3Abin03]